MLPFPCQCQDSTECRERGRATGLHRFHVSRLPPVAMLHEALPPERVKISIHLQCRFLGAVCTWAARMHGCPDVCVDLKFPES